MPKADVAAGIEVAVNGVAAARVPAEVAARAAETTANGRLFTSWIKVSIL